MRDCSSASRAEVSAGMRPLLRMTNAATKMPDSKAPLKALATQGGPNMMPDQANMPQPYRPATAPMATATVYCATGCRRANIRLDIHASNSHDRVAGKAPPVTIARRMTQSTASFARKATPTAADTSTNNTARNTTPVWQASKTRPASSGSASAGRLSSADGGMSWNADNIWVSFMNPDFDSITRPAHHVQKPTR